MQNSICIFKMQQQQCGFFREAKKIAVYFRVFLNMS